MVDAMLSRPVGQQRASANAALALDEQRRIVDRRVVVQIARRRNACDE